MNRVLSAPFGADTLGLYGLLLLETCLVMLLSLALLRFQLRRGWIAHGARQSGRASRAAVQSGQPRRSAGLFELSPLKRRELILLLRDRRLLAQCLGVPILMTGTQFIFNDHVVGHLAQAPGALASVAFSVGAYTLIQSALLALTAEEGTLWLLYTFPRPPLSVLWERAQLHLAVALICPLAVCVACLFLSPVGPTNFIIGFAFALAGLMAYSAIAAALAVLYGADRRGTKASYTYLFMLLAGCYAYALYSSDWRQECSMFLLSGALAFALWQKAGDRVPYLLDPGAAPPSKVALADGMIAATLFFILQIVFAALLKHFVHGDAPARIALAYVCAGALTYGLVLRTFAARGTHGVPKIVGAGNASSVGAGVAVGLLCAAVGVTYLWLARHYGFLPDTAHQHRLSTQVRLSIDLLAVLAAPVFEEFIFRGLIFGGLRRSLGLLPSALGSAVLFASAHPWASLAPVFVVGLGTAWVYERSRTLWAPMLTHASYNLVIVTYSLFVLQF